MGIDQIPVEVARHVLGYFGDEHGRHGGDFPDALMTAYGKADQSNRARLALGFPDLAEAMRLAMDTSDGIAVLVRLVLMAQEPLMPDPMPVIKDILGFVDPDPDDDHDPDGFTPADEMRADAQRYDRRYGE